MKKNLYGASPRASRRSLKFRVWSGEEMISPDYIDREGWAHWKEDSIPRISEKVMQFTGVKDGRGREIYEGDLVRTPRGVIGTIRFANGRFVWTDGACNWELLQDIDGRAKRIPDRIVGHIYQGQKKRRLAEGRAKPEQEIPSGEDPR